MVTLLYDGACAFCSREAAWFERRANGKLELIDISAPYFDAHQWGLNPQEVQAELHARTHNGKWIKGWQSTVLCLEAIGYGKTALFLRFKPFKPVLNVSYQLFARHRVFLSQQMIRIGLLPKSLQCTKTCTPHESLVKK